MVKPLEGATALVAGATRGGGRGIAVALGAAGATVYCTGRSTRADSGRTNQVALDAENRAAFQLARRPETIEETAERVDAAGGQGIAIRADHTQPDQVQAVVDRIRAERGGLDVLVNCVWGGDELVEFGTPFWELSLEAAGQLMSRALTSHLITARLAVPLILDRSRGLVVEVTDGDGLFYRGNMVYDLIKTAVSRLAFAMAEELRPRGIAALAITPGFLRSEAMLDYMGVTEATWREGIALDPHFACSESPAYLGAAVAALASDPEVFRHSGGSYSTWALQPVYGYTDADGSTPNWGANARAHDFGRDQQASHDRYVRGFAVDEPVRPAT